MLILSRRTGESLVIDDRKITITVLSVKGNQVRIGIDAPKNVSIYREEIFKRIQNAIESKVNKTDGVVQEEKDTDDE